MRRLVLVLSDCADEEKPPPPLQITELIKQRWDRTVLTLSFGADLISSLYSLNHPNYGSSAVRIMQPVLRFLQGPPTQITASGYHSTHPSLSFVRRTSRYTQSRTHLTVLSRLITRSIYLRLATRCMKAVDLAVRCRQLTIL